MHAIVEGQRDSAANKRQCNGANIAKHFSDVHEGSLHVYTHPILHVPLDLVLSQCLRLRFQLLAFLLDREPLLWPPSLSVNLVPVSLSLI